jgi:hypothetical protein
MSLNSDALEAAIRTLRLTQDAIPARWSEDTADELLTLVAITFHEYTVAVLADPLPAGTADDGPALGMRAALHGRAIADLLTALAIAHWKDAGSEESLTAEAPAKLTRHWINAIAEATHSEDHPQHRTAVEYVRGAALGMSFIARILNATRGLSLDPEDPRGPAVPSEDAMTGEDAGGLLIWCAAAALCIAAELQPQFRIQADQ